MYTEAFAKRLLGSLLKMYFSSLAAVLNSTVIVWNSIWCLPTHVHILKLTAKGSVQLTKQLFKDTEGLKNYLNIAPKDTPQMTTLCSVMLTLSNNFSRLSLTGKIKSLSDTGGEIWVMVRLQGKVKGKESLFLTPSAMCNSPSALCPVDMPKHQKDVYEEFLFMCEHLSSF